MNKQILFLATVLLLLGKIHGQVVSTFAGSGIIGDIDANGTNASFNQPNGICIDATGNLYVVEYKNYKIRRITPSGDVTTFAGSGVKGSMDGFGTSASFYGPTGICIDSDGNFYVTDFLNQRIRKISPATDVTTFAGSGLIGHIDANGMAATFNYPADNVTDASGNIYVVDKENHKIRKMTPSGDVTTFAGSGNQGFMDGNGTSASFNKPSGICIDATGNFFISDQYNQKIRKITPSGDVTTFAGSGVLGATDGLAANASFNYPTGICVDVSGNVFVADYSNNKIRKITPDGVVSTYAGSGVQGSTDGLATVATFHSPTGICVTDLGVLYVGDQFNHKIRKIVPATASINENMLAKFEVYPNPTSHIITIAFTNHFEKSTFRLSDLTGKQILKGKFENKINTLNLSSFETGIYFLEVIANHGKATKKIIIK